MASVNPMTLVSEIRSGMVDIQEVVPLLPTLVFADELHAFVRMIQEDIQVLQTKDNAIKALEDCVKPYMRNPTKTLLNELKTYKISNAIDTAVFNLKSLRIFGCHPSRGKLLAYEHFEKTFYNDKTNCSKPNQLQIFIIRQCELIVNKVLPTMKLIHKELNSDTTAAHIVMLEKYLSDRSSNNSSQDKSSGIKPSPAFRVTIPRMTEQTLELQYINEFLPTLIFSEELYSFILFMKQVKETIMSETDASRVPSELLVKTMRFSPSEILFDHLESVSFGADVENAVWALKRLKNTGCHCLGSFGFACHLFASTAEQNAQRIKQKSPLQAYVFDSCHIIVVNLIPMLTNMQKQTTSEKSMHAKKLDEIQTGAADTGIYYVDHAPTATLNDAIIGAIQESKNKEKESQASKKARRKMNVE